MQRAAIRKALLWAGKAVFGAASLLLAAAAIWDEPKRLIESIVDLLHSPINQAIGLIVVAAYFCVLFAVRPKIQGYVEMNTLDLPERRNVALDMEGDFASADHLHVTVKDGGIGVHMRGKYQKISNAIISGDGTGVGFLSGNPPKLPIKPQD